MNFFKYLSSLIFLSIVFFQMNQLTAQTIAEQDPEYSENSDDLCCEHDCPAIFPCVNKFTIGPEFYHVRRTREGGTRQHGTLIGVRGTFDHIKRYRLYWGGDFLYATGTLRGKVGSGAKIKSRFTDELAEGRIGYTFQYKFFPFPAFTPYIGYGRFSETNKFRPPSPLTVKFRTHYNYLAFGFLSCITINQQWCIGANLRMRAFWNAKCKVSDDPDFDDTTQQIGSRINYRVEVPVVYRVCQISDSLELGLVPFYEFRHYGGRENFPFDFFETKLRIYGVNIQFGYCF